MRGHSFQIRFVIGNWNIAIMMKHTVSKHLCVVMVNEIQQKVKFLYIVDIIIYYIHFCPILLTKVLFLPFQVPRYDFQTHSRSKEKVCTVAASVLMGW